MLEKLLNFVRSAEVGSMAVNGKGDAATVKAMQKFFGTKQDGVISGQNASQKKYRPALTAVKNGKGGSACVKKMQQWCGLSNPDGIWGATTSKGLQKKLVALGYLPKNEVIDGVAGPKTFKALQECLNNNGKAKPTPKPTPTPTPTNAQKLVNKAKEICWPYGTDPVKWKYKTGNPTAAFNKLCGKASRVTKSDCGYFIEKLTKAAGLGAWNPLNDKMPSKYKIVHSGSKIPDGLLQPGDIIWYKKKDGQHTLLYLDGNKIAEAGRKYRFPVIRDNTKKYNKSDVKYNTIKVARAK